MESEKIIEGVLKEFSQLAGYPRPSHHEKAVSNYIAARLRELGLDPVQDEAWNVIADKAASPGYEDAPRVIIQGHMDMVCVAEEGRSYDPLRDPIVLHRDGDILSAEGTSLGADDGVSEAISFFLLQQEISHGPLRFIFTVDEEVSMTGALNLDPKYVEDAQYIINCDSEEYDVLTVGSAGSVHMDFSRSIHWQKVPSGCKAMNITVSGLIGGHSGESINEGKANAIKELGIVLQQIRNKQIHFSLASIDGGAAANAIPAKAAAVILIQSSDMPAISRIVAHAAEEFRLKYGEKETGGKISLTPLHNVPDTMFSDTDTAAAVQLLCLLHFGVSSMNQILPRIPENSANIGTIRLEKDVLTIQYFPRSSKDACLRELVSVLPAAAELTGFTLQCSSITPAWTENPHSRLVPLMSRIFKEQNQGKEMRIETIHGGLETGYFFSRNPKLDIVSVGPTTQHIHSPQEILVLSSLPPLVNLIIETLRRLK